MYISCFLPRASWISWCDGPILGETHLVLIHVQPEKCERVCSSEDNNLWKRGHKLVGKCSCLAFTWTIRRCIPYSSGVAERDRAPASHRFDQPNHYFPFHITQSCFWRILLKCPTCKILPPALLGGGQVKSLYHKLSWKAELLHRVLEWNHFSVGQQQGPHCWWMVRVPNITITELSLQWIGGKGRWRWNVQLRGQFFE